MAEKVFYAIVTQFDCEPNGRFMQVGPLLHERYLHGEASSSEALTKNILERFSKYGWARIAKVIVDIPEGES